MIDICMEKLFNEVFAPIWGYKQNKYIFCNSNKCMEIIILQNTCGTRYGNAVAYSLSNNAGRVTVSIEVSICLKWRFIRWTSI